MKRLANRFVSLTSRLACKLIQSKRIRRTRIQEIPCIGGHRLAVEAMLLYSPKRWGACGGVTVALTTHTQSKAEEKGTSAIPFFSNWPSRTTSRLWFAMRMLPNEGCCAAMLVASSPNSFSTILGEPGFPHCCYCLPPVCHQNRRKHSLFLLQSLLARQTDKQ
jgi:hypothetical protein